MCLKDKGNSKFNDRNSNEAKLLASLLAAQVIETILDEPDIGEIINKINK